MARGFQDPRQQITDLDDIAVADAQIDICDFRGLVVRRHDPAAIFLLQLTDAADMVVVVVGDEDIRQRPALLLQCPDDGSGLGRVDRSRRLGRGIVDQVAEIVGQAGESTDFGGHGISIRHRASGRNYAQTYGVNADGAMQYSPRGVRRGRDRLGDRLNRMSIDVIDLRDFYSRRLGIVARELINRGIRARWPRADGQRVLGIGYPTPYLGLFREDSERCLAFMPAAQGVLKWPTARPALATLIDEFSMPLPDAAVDRILLVHALEMSDDPERLLREVWRVLAPSGRLIAVIPNRRGVWTRTDNTPFGHGRPYSRAQITQLLRQTWFTPASWGEALFLPPVGNSWFLRSAMAWERVGAALSLPFAGVHIVEATKQVYRAIPVGRERTRLIPSLEPVLVPSSTATRDKLGES